MIEVCREFCEVFTQLKKKFQMNLDRSHILVEQFVQVWFFSLSQLAKFGCWTIHTWVVTIYWFNVTIQMTSIISIFFNTQSLQIKVLRLDIFYFIKIIFYWTYFANEWNNNCVNSNRWQHVYRWSSFPFSVSWLTQLHRPSLFSFHKLILLSPPDTPRMLPVSDQLTFQTTSSKVWRIVGVQVVMSSVFQIMTRRSCEQLAMRDDGKPMLGAQATSRTQSEWTSMRFSSIQRSPSSFQILTVLSQPPETNRFTFVASPFEFCFPRWSKAASGTADGHQLNALHPIVWAFGIFLYSNVPVSVLQVRTEIDPSELPQAKTRP